MKRILTFLVLLFVNSSFNYGVSTHYLSDFRFDILENYEFSNVSITENGSIELARDYTNIYISKEMLWSLEKNGDGFLAGTGESANLYNITSRGSEKVFSASNYILFPAISLMGNQIYLTGIPKGTLFVLDKKYNLKKRLSFSNDYLWDIVPADDGYFLLGGNPAGILYLDKNDQLQWSAKAEGGANNLLHGVYNNGILYVSGDNNVLYKISLKDSAKERKFSAIASFDNSIVDFLLNNDKIYLITSSKDQKKAAQNPASEGLSVNDDDSSSSSSTAVQSDNRKTKLPVGKSSLFAVDTDGSMETLFEKNNMRFTALSSMNQVLFIAGDRGAGYFEYSLTNRTKKYTSMGKGKFVRFVGLENAVYGVLIEPSRIVKLLPNYARQGYFISSAVDTGNVSRWGVPLINAVSNSGNEIDFLTRSSAVFQDSLWESWKGVAKNVSSSPGQYIQYRADFFSDGKTSSLLKSLVIPFIQKNHKPLIDKINASYNNNNQQIHITWDSSDPDKDPLIFDLFLSQNGRDWLKVNDKPLEDSTFDLPKDLFPEGKYRIKIRASDEKANLRDDAGFTEKISDPFTIDNRAPDIGSISTRRLSDGVWVQFTAKDSFSPIFDASYTINGGRWNRIQPDSGIYDSTEESFFFRIDLIYPAAVQIRVSDIYGNSSVKGFFLDKE